QAGQPRDLGDLDSSTLHRLDERIGQPLGELMERRQLISGIAGLDRGMAPAVPKGNAAEHDPPRPDRSEMLQHLRQDGGCGNSSVRRKTCQMIEKSTGPGVIVPCKNGRRIQYGAPEATQEPGAPLNSGQRIARTGQEAVDKRRTRQSLKLYRIDAQPLTQ